GPNGMDGRPGWHIECSAMSMDILGETFDIHGGGIDLQFPHHEDEIAQSEAATGKTFARFWLHNGHIRVNKEKMSKSLGNFFTIKEILEKCNPLVLRYFLLSTHYRMPVEFTDDLLEQAKNSLMRVQDCYRAVARIANGKPDNDTNPFDLPAIIKTARLEFEKAMDNDFEISAALGAIFDFVAKANIDLKNGDISILQAKEIVSFFHSIDSVLGVIVTKEESDTEIEWLISERNEARKNKNFARSDEIRDQLQKKGIILEDSSGGTTWKRAL
ncbi:MAG: DALR domain-containing protein, partial [Patescibacteria group bacterium]